MKTVNLKSKIKNNIIILPLMIAALFLLDSCQKEEQGLPSPSNKSNSERQIQSANAENTLYSADQADVYHADASQLQAKGVHSAAYEMLKIDHIASRSLAPDYSVTVFTDGKVVFEGRRNVAVKEIVTMHIQDAIVQQLNGLFLKSNFSTINNDLPNLADIPQVLTSFNQSSDRADVNPRTLKDYNNGYPAELISLRVKAEFILNISHLVYGESRGVTALETASE